MQPPFQLGPYRVVGQVGAGGFATVYRAVVSGDMGFERDVALKVLHSHITRDTPEVVAMLADEARLLARMQHPNIVYVQWFGRLAHPEAGEVFVMAMEFVQGRSWRSLLQEQRGIGRPTPLSVVLDVHTDIARGLQFAHVLRDQQGLPLGLVHRDLKPDNVMLAQAGVVKLLDFGIAKATERLAEATRTDLVRGTVHYMSPEQVIGVKDLDFRSDLFSFGAMLFEAATSRRMIQADTVVPAVRELADFDPTPALEEAASVHAELPEILGKLLAPDRDDRYGSTAALVDALQRMRGHIEAGQPTAEWLADRVSPMGDTAAVETPPDLRRSSAARPPERLSTTVAVSTPPGSQGVGPTRPMGPFPTPPAEPDGPPASNEFPVSTELPARRRKGAAWLLPTVLVVGVLLGVLLPKLMDRADPPTSGDPVAVADPPDMVGTPTPEVPPDIEASPAHGEIPATPTAAPPTPSATRPAPAPTTAPTPAQPTPEPTPEPTPAATPVAAVDAAPGTVRLAADHEFEVSIGGRTYKQLEARQGIELPAGSYTARFTCIRCPEGVAPRVSVDVTVEAGARTVRRVDFPKEGTP